MMSYADNIIACLQCPRRGPAQGACPCTIDGADIKEHAHADYCPEKRFGPGRIPLSWPSAGLGDTVKKILDLPLVRNVVAAVKPDDCGCAGRQKAMNEAAPYRSSKEPGAAERPEPGGEQHRAQDDGAEAGDAPQP